jgi:hypothetical protein
MSQVRSPSPTVSAAAAEHRRCVEIVYNAAKLYREMAHQFTTREAKLIARSQAQALEDVAREMEDI